MKKPILSFFEENKLKPRDLQIKVLNLVEENWDKYDYFVLSCPTGVGKTYIADAIADAIKNAYIITSTIQLQNQYEGSWDQIVNLKGRGNYKCNLNPEFTVDCAPCTAQPELIKSCIATKMCAYYNQRDRALASPVMLTNPLYLLYSVHCGFASKDSGTAVPQGVTREALIVDECVRGDVKIWIDNNHTVSMREIYNNSNITHVLSYNEKTSVYEQKRILRRMRSNYDEKTPWIKIHLDVNGIKTQLKTTGNHKIWTKNRGYVRADELTADDILKFDMLPKKDVTRKFISDRVEKSKEKNGTYNKNHVCESCNKLFTPSGYENHLKAILEIRKCKHLDCESLFEISKTTFNKIYCSLHKKLYSFSEIERTRRSKTMKEKNLSFDDEIRKKIADTWKYNWKYNRSEESKQAQLVRFKNAPIHNNIRKPNKLEQFIIDLNLPNVNFTGLGEKWVTFKNGKHKNPDFIIENTKKVIEIGDVYFWHTQEEIENVKQEYAKIGYECLYITNKDLETTLDETLIQLNKFVYNHDVKITKITKPKRKYLGGGDHFKYNIEVEDNHNYFANNILISNCHNMESHLIQFSESKLNISELHEKHGVQCKHLQISENLPTNYELVQNLQKLLVARSEFLKEKIDEEFPGLKNVITGNIKDWAKGISKKVAEKASKLNNQLYQIDKVLQAVNIFFKTHETFEELSSRWLIHPDVQNNTLTLTPLKAYFLFDEYFGKLAEKFVFMSATIGSCDQFCKDLGIDRSRTFYVESDTPFAPEKSPVMVFPLLKMGYKDIDKTLPQMVKTVDQILDEHPIERGIIHSASYKIQNELLANISRVNRNRLVARDMSGGEKYSNQQLIELHTRSNKNKNTVLLSPSMMEGVDLYDDLSTFQIILKFPWASLGDPRVKAKSEAEPNWYSNSMWIHVMQASGRSTRHEEDTSVTYILDASFPYFFSTYKSNLPTWFKNRIIFLK